jgi:hypothetical protein
MLLALRNLTDGNEAAGSFTQAAVGWSATASEDFTSTASFSQAATTWAAVAAEAFAATGSFVQAAAAWSAIAAETFASSATWAQAAAAWSASASTGAAFTSTATWAQAPASWAATSGNGPCVDAFDPAAFSDAFSICAPVGVTTGGGRIWGPAIRPVLRPPEPVHAVAAFAQQPAGWSARVDVNDDDLLLGFSEDALLELVPA